MSKFPTETYSNALLRYKALVGVESLSSYEEDIFKADLKDRFRQGFQKYAWPEYCVLGEEKVLGSNLIRSYAPTGAPAGPTTLVSNADTVLGVYKEDPNFTLKPTEYIFNSTYDGFGYPAVRIITDQDMTGQTVFVSYRMDLDEAIKATPSPFATIPVFGNGAGEANEIHQGLSSYAIYGAYVQYLKGDGQNQKAIIEEQMADRILFEAIEKIEDHGRGHLHHRFDGRPKSQFNRHQVAQAGPVTLPGQGK